MPRDIAPLNNSLEHAILGNQDDVYPLLVDWDRSIETALERSGHSRFLEVMRQYLEEVITVVDRAATDDDDEIDWAFLEDCVNAYPPAIGDHNCSAVLANVVARCVIRTRVRDGVEAIPAWALEYLATLTIDEDTEWGWESGGAFGWGVGHPDVPVLEQVLTRVEDGEIGWTLNVLEHVTFADAESGVDLLEDLLRSPDTVEDLVFLHSLAPPLEQSFPDFPQYWEPATELEYEPTLSEDLIERLLAVLGETIEADRLRHFDDMHRFDLERAADEYAPATGDQ